MDISEVSKINAEIIPKEIRIKNNKLGEVVTIGIFQIKSPFFDEYDKIQEMDQHVLVQLPHPKNLPKEYERWSRLKNILNHIESINKNRQNKLNIVVFPEYSIPFEKLDTRFIKNFVNKTEIIFIGNFYDKSDRSSKSFIIFPEGWTDTGQYYSKKCTISTYDKDVLNYDIKTEVLKFSWTPKNKESEGYFQIMTCKDYLYFTSPDGIKSFPSIIDVERPGIIIVPNCTPEMTTFACQASLLIRNSNFNQGIKCLVSVFCNATDLETQLDPIGICGNSQIVAPIESEFRSNLLIPKGIEGLLIAEINPFNALMKPTPIKSPPNAVIYGNYRYKIKKDGSLEDDNPKEEHYGVIVNPEVFKKAGLTKIYGLMKIEDYSKIKEEILKLHNKTTQQSVGIDAVYGYHDLIMQSYEHVQHNDDIVESLKLRLWPLISNNDLYNEDNFGYCIVKKILKIHGISLLSESIDIIEKDVSILFKNDLFIKLVTGRKNIPIELINKLIENNICLKARYDLSDRSFDEINRKIPEYLIFLEIIKLRGHDTSQDKSDLFEKEILSKLLSDERVRTIEEVQSSKNSFITADFIIHVVGMLDDLNDIVLNKIYGYSCLRFECRTQVYIPAENILHNDFPVLLEHAKLVPYQSTEIVKIMKKYKENTKPEDFLHPFAIRRIPPDRNELISQILKIKELFDELDKKYYWGKGPIFNDEVLKFIYGISKLVALDYDKDEKEKDIEKYLIKQDFILSISRSIEKKLKAHFKNIISKNSLTDEEFIKIINYSSNLKKEKGMFHYPKLELGTVSRILGYIKGHTSDKDFQKKMFNYLIQSFDKSTITDEQKEKINREIELTDKIFIEILKIFGDNPSDITKRLRQLQEFTLVRNNLTAHDTELDDKFIEQIPSYTMSGLKVLISVTEKIGC